MANQKKLQLTWVSKENRPRREPVISPQSRCEWSHNDYSLNVENLPQPLPNSAKWGQTYDQDLNRQKATH